MPNQVTDRLGITRHVRIMGRSCLLFSVLPGLTTTARSQTDALKPQANFTVEVRDLSPKFLDFYEAAIQTHADPDQRWQLWKEKYDFAAMPPIPAGQQMAREQLDAAWPQYPAAIPRIRLGAASLTPSPPDRLIQIATLLGAEGPVRIRLIAFVGSFRRNAFSSGLRDGVSTIAIPLEDSDQDRDLDMTHEFTHAVQMQMGGWSKQDVASAIFAEGLAMKVTEHLHPGLTSNVYAASTPEWMHRCSADLPAVLHDLQLHITDTGAEAVSKLIYGTGAAGIEREVYCGGWFVVEKMMEEGMTYAQLGQLKQSDAEARVTTTLKLMLSQ